MTLRLTIFFLISSFCLLASGQTKVLSLDSVRASDDVEGYWELTAGGAVIEFRRQPGQNRAYDIYLVDSPDYTLPSGTRLGAMQSTAIEGKYDAELLADPRQSSSRKSRKFIFDISDGYLRMSPYKTGKSVRLYRLLPYLFRFSVRDENSRPEGIDGAVRIAPRTNERIIVL